MENKNDKEVYYENKKYFIRFFFDGSDNHNITIFS